MINIPKDYAKNVSFLNKDFIKLVDFFNKLENDLAYPKCSGYEDQKRVLAKAEKDLIMWGKV